MALSSAAERAIFSPRHFPFSSSRTLGEPENRRFSEAEPYDPGSMHTGSIPGRVPCSWIPLVRHALGRDDELCVGRFLNQTAVGLTRQSMPAGARTEPRMRELQSGGIRRCRLVVGLGVAVAPGCKRGSAII
jgi:hypothetical protein